MPNKMLIDATHPEETRVVVLRGNRVEEFDFESANRKQLRGNIYLAKVTRVEPSLQAAFVDYGGNRHGFLAFSEIHPDYYQIPVADRQALIAEEERAQRAADAEADHRARPPQGRRERAGAQAARRDQERAGRSRTSRSPPWRRAPSRWRRKPAPSRDDVPRSRIARARRAGSDIAPSHESRRAKRLAAADAARPRSSRHELEASDAAEPAPDRAKMQPPVQTSRRRKSAGEAAPRRRSQRRPTPTAGNGAEVRQRHRGQRPRASEEEVIELVGGADAMEEVPERAPRLRRQYKIQEVIKRRQVMLVQVVKEERGTKGAALTTYLSLAGRYSVLMPNTARGGGISRKITSRGGPPASSRKSRRSSKCRKAWA